MTHDDIKAAYCDGFADGVASALRRLQSHDWDRAEDLWRSSNTFKKLPPKPLPVKLCQVCLGAGSVITDQNDARPCPACSQPNGPPAIPTYMLQPEVVECCHKTRLVGQPCPLGRQCLYSGIALGPASLPLQHTGIEL